MSKEMTAITQVHLYIKEHYVPGDLICTKLICDKLRHLTHSSVSAALWKLSTEQILVCDNHSINRTCNLYMVDTEYMKDRGHEDREAPEQGVPRKRKCKKEIRNA